MKTTVDFAAVGRVARHTELKGIRVVEISAKCNPKAFGALKPSVELQCALVNRDGNALEVACNYTFAVHSGEALAAEATIGYLLFYELAGPGPFAEDDLLQFAHANGALHSWPFVRELLYDLTSKMGYPPFTLPVMHFQPKGEAKAPPPASDTEGTAAAPDKVPQSTE